MRKVVLALVGFLVASLGAEEWCWQPPDPSELVPNWCENVRLEGSIFYWRVDSSHWEYVSKSSSTPHFSKQRVKSISIDGAPGFRVGGEVKLPCYGWSMALFWTHQDCRGSDHTKIKPKEGKSIAFSLPPIENFSEIISIGQEAFIRGRLKWRYEVFDFEMGQWLSLCDCICARPFFGVRLADIHENLKDKAMTSPDLEVSFIRLRIKCEHKGIGPRAGLDMYYPISDGVGAFGGVAGSLIWGNVENRSKSTTVRLGEGIAKGRFQENVTLLRPMLDLKLGLEWRFRACCCLPVTLSASWEAHCLFNQFRYFVTELPGSNPDSNPTSMRNWKTVSNVATQGITLTGSVEW